MSDLGKEIFNIDIPTIQPDCGRVLVSEPFLREDYFRHSVVFLVDHEFKGKSMGIVMNHPT
ncbi:MAG: YqgE/AlgH family protein, partial [Muribaculaceae bacterium]|nr:YqgE/AlgH family protein [Muribaculaceae bacterium]